MKQNTFLKVFFGLFVVMLVSYSLAGYSAKRAQIESPDLFSKIAKNYNLEINDSGNGFYITNIETGRDFEESQKTWDIDGQQTELEVLAKSADVRLEKSADAQFHVIAEGLLSREKENDELFEVTVKRNKIQIHEKRTKSTTLTIQVPGQLSDVEFKSVSGDLNAEAIVIKDLEVATVSGDITLNKIQLTDLEAGSVSGNVNISSIITGNIEVGSTSGDVSISTKDVEKANLKLKSVSGNILNAFKGEPSSQRKIEISTISGNIELTEPK